MERLVDRILRGQPASAAGEGLSREVQEVAEVFGFAAPARELEFRPWATPSALPWERLGPYRLLEKLGEGGMGWVFLAEQERLGRRVALKVVRPQLAQSPRSRERFRREALAVARLRHPHIVTVFDADEDQGVPYLVMEHVPGQGLNEILRAATERGERVPIARTLTWARDLARALACAHEAGIVHRDVKPSNVLIGDDGRAMLLDFGLASVADMEGISIQHEFRGSLHYASPEQIAGGRVAIDARSDVYSLGVLLYECLAGRRPFRGDATPQVFHQILTKEPEPIGRLVPGLPAELEALVAKALRKDPAARHATAGEMAEALERCLGAPPAPAAPPAPVAPPAPAARREGHRLRAFTVVPLLLLAGSLLWWTFTAGFGERDVNSAASTYRSPGWDPAPRRLFGDETRVFNQRLDDWGPTEGGGTFGDDPDALRPAVIGDCRVGSVSRRLALGAAEFRLSGALAPMPVYDPERLEGVITGGAGLRLEWPSGRALALTLAPAGGGHRAELRERSEENGAWRRIDPPSDGGSFDEEHPLSFVIECTASGARAGHGSQAGTPGWVDVSLPGPSAGSPELILFVERGSARFIDFCLELRP